MDNVVGKIVRVIEDKQYGFIRVKGHSGDFFFHAQDYNGSWIELAEIPSSKFPQVTGVIVESAKGPRLADVTPVWEEIEDGSTPNRPSRSSQ